MLQLYNSLTGKKEVFIPLKAREISLYVCGMTVYDDCHLGHARTMVCFDVITRFLRSQGFTVKFVRNITDIDDKIINRALELDIPINDLTARYIASMQDDERALLVLKPDLEPKATEHIASILDLTQKLIDKGYAYCSNNGDVCFEVEKFNTYGKIANKDVAGLVAGARIEVVKEKRSPLDFVLWKKAKPLEPSWPSPWGDGRPGWHIECSAMSMLSLGEQFDIHGGGLDLKFPHHENENAQSEASSGKLLANYWLHVGMLQINGAKMSKSLGNFLTIKDALKQHHPESLRYFLLSSHYRSDLNYSLENLNNAHKALLRLYQSLKDINIDNNYDELWMEKFNQAMLDDFNTPLALSILFDLSREINKTGSAVLANTLKKLANNIGLLQSGIDEFLQFSFKEYDKAYIEQLIQQRVVARETKNWRLADELRDKIVALGIELEDGSTGTTWRIRAD